MKSTARENLYKAAEVMAGVMEVLHWIGAGCLAALGICAAAAGDWLTENLYESGRSIGPTINTYGFEITAANGRIEAGAIWVFAIGAVIIMALMSLVCRNVRLILKHSRGTTPFQRDNVRMLREIGIFFLAIPAVSLVMSMLIILIFGDAMEAATLDMTHIVMGIFMLCLSLVFDHGVALETETEGLV